MNFVSPYQSILVQFLDRLHLFKSTLSTYMHVLSGLPLFHEGPLTWSKSLQGFLYNFSDFRDLFVNTRNVLILKKLDHVYHVEK